MSRWRSSTVSALLVVGFLRAAPLPAQERFDEVRRRAQAAREKIGAPGLVLGVAQGDRQVFAEGYGRADVENDVACAPDTVFRIASISKPVAAVAILQLSERGRLGLDDPVRKYVPAFPAKGDAVITVRHVLTHTSGIRHYAPGEMDSRVPYRSVTDALAVFKDDPLLFAPGTRYFYSSHAYNLLAAVVEAVSGLDYDAYLKERVFAPAGMSTTFLEHQGDIVRHRGRQYELEAGALRNAPLADLSVKWAAGGVISTVEDLLRFHVALDQGKLLRPETLRQMYTPGTLNDGTVLDYALGWDVRTDAAGRRWVAHSGGATGGSSYLLRSPDDGTAVAVLCNLAGAGRALGQLSREIAEVLAPAPAAAPLR
jgi:serine beta-lactamase-like protein LACTB, mitochondrial